MRQENNNSNNHVYYIIYVIVLFLIVAMFITWRGFVMPKVYESPKIYNHYVWNPDSIKSDMIVCPDSVSLEKYLEHIDSISRVAIQKCRQLHIRCGLDDFQIKCMDGNVAWYLCHHYDCTDHHPVCHDLQE